MTDREKLIELIKVFDEAPEKTCPYPEGEPDCENCEYNINKFLCDVQARKADYLIKNRVYVAPCDVGDTVYWLDLRTRVIHKRKVAEILIARSRAMLITLSDGYLHGVSDFGISLFCTREEAEKALAERSNKQ
jgi:hypothetical protein